MTSPAAMVADDIILRVRSRKEHPWVSRGGSKLQHAIQEFQLQSQVLLLFTVNNTLANALHFLL
jgi:predicted rRNA methylase YqxC with S4 and FtsJ domains